MPVYDELPPWPWARGEAEGEIIRRASEARVGAWALVHDINCRVYKRSAQVGGEGPVERYYYRPAKIIGENRASWIFNGKAYPKKPRISRSARFYGLDDAEDQLWLSVHGLRISDRVRYLRDPELMRRVADLIGYDAEKVA